MKTAAEPIKRQRIAQNHEDWTSLMVPSVSHGIDRMWTSSQMWPSKS